MSSALPLAQFWDLTKRVTHLSSLSPYSKSLLELNEQDYVDLLKNFDWYYDYSDDHRVWQRGWDLMQVLLWLRSRFDPDGEIWKQYEPKPLD